MRIVSPLYLRLTREANSSPHFSGKYREAFLTCRKHRIDLNILYDHDPAAFMQHLTSFVEQIDAVDYINLFLSGLKYVAPLFFGLVHSNLTLHLVS